ncbi:MAG: 4Fe-4S dicluster domain-containing protein [Planctomycetota bacterium]|nr:4Fe-4S dicluster domain-containing protein [Planctomycetota bacterium]
MRVRMSSDTVNSDALKKIEEMSGQKVLSCYQCGKCSAGCPMSFAMDLLPNQIIRLVQLGLWDEVLAAKTIWICASCFTCFARCPRGVDLSRVMEALRLVTLRMNVNHIEPSKLPREALAAFPPIALVSCFRKMTS